MKPGYYMFKPMGYPIEITEDMKCYSLNGEFVSKLIKPSDLEPATLKDLVLWGGEFDKSKIVVEGVAWTASDGSDEWFSADSEEEAIAQAKERFPCKKTILIADEIIAPDPGDVMPSADSLLEGMLENCDDDNSMFYAGTQAGWLDRVTKEDEQSLEDAIRTTIYGWLAGTGNWPAGFQVGPTARRVRIDGDGTR